MTNSFKDTCQICNLTPETVNDDLTEEHWEDTRFLSVIYLYAF